MAKARPDSVDGLSALYIFDSEGLKEMTGGGNYVVDRCASCLQEMLITPLSYIHAQWKSNDLKCACVRV
jgi:hypothetical protein